ncbi:MAG TPA: hypothetical protein DCE81_02515 [Cytophagales bacterium]|nr:hypothetical protein [Cytophagales bacterium]
MDHFLEKYQSLNPTTRQEVNDFVDFLLNQQKRKSFDLRKWKKKILKISTWTAEEVKPLARNKLRSWKPVQW